MFLRREKKYGVYFIGIYSFWVWPKCQNIYRLQTISKTTGYRITVLFLYKLKKQNPVIPTLAIQSVCAYSLQNTGADLHKLVLSRSLLTIHMLLN